MSEVSHYGTRPSRCPPEAILHYASRDWPTDVTSAYRGGAPSYYISPVVTSSLQSIGKHLFLAPGKEGGLVTTLLGFLSIFSFLSIFARYLTM